MEIATDFAQVVDGLEEVTLRRRDGMTSIAVIAARRQGVQQREAEPSGGAVTEANAEWHLALAENLAPRVGDVVVDAQGGRWTILVAEELPQLGRWKCVTRELRIAYGCGERIDIERPIWSTGETPEIVGYVYVATALPVRIQPVTVSSYDQATFRIILGESLALEPGDRFVAGDGTIYTLQSYEQAERIDVLPVAMVVRGEA
ncbi:MAG: hypothetical protein SH868_17130 [Bythopirellula sp.]|nr:hypothetical protein [Bythopirellula sp.]